MNAYANSQDVQPDSLKMGTGNKWLDLSLDCLLRKWQVTAVVLT
jgi:hypothetical protein